MEILPKTLGTRPRLAVEVRAEGVVAARAEDEGIDEGVDHEPDDQAHGGQGEEDWQVPVDDADEPPAEGLELRRRERGRTKLVVADSEEGVDQDVGGEKERQEARPRHRQERLIRAELIGERDAVAASVEAAIAIEEPCSCLARDDRTEAEVVQLSGVGGRRGSGWVVSGRHRGGIWRMLCL